jgi:alpha-L-fucosidase
MAGRGERQRRFDDAKFGLFVHWGAYSVDGVEASWPVMLGPELQRRFVEALHRLGMGEVEMPANDITLAEYEALPQRFVPERFDAGEWVDLARDAGQRYMVLTTKHHDGFAMFRTATTDYGITHGPFGRDVTGELAAACQTGGIGFGAYFSAPDVHDEGYRDLDRALPETFLGQPERPEWAGFLDRMEAQVREVCTQYGELFSFWWDIGMGPQWPLERFHSIVRELQPAALLNDRLGGLAPGVPPELAADFLTPEQSVPRSIPRRSTFHLLDPVSLFGIIQRDDWEEVVERVAPVVQASLAAPPDLTLPSEDDFLPWEACHTFGGQWAWNPDLGRCRTGPELIVDLVEVASRGGNLLMNVGPRPDGTIQPEFQAALREVGRWLADHGDGIHGTTFGPVQGVEGVRSTASDGHVYLHLLDGDAPGGSPVRVPLAEPIGAGRVLGSGASVGLEVEGGDLVVDLGRAPRHPVVTTIELDRSPG